jgi:hypothetical protein
VHLAGNTLAKEVAMMKTVLIAAGVIAGLGFAAAQDQVPGNKSEAATPAPSVQQNAPPDRVAPGPLDSTKAPPDAKAESDTPTLKMDSATETKLLRSKEKPGGEAARSPP